MNRCPRGGMFAESRALRATRDDSLRWLMPGSVPMTTVYRDGATLRFPGPKVSHHRVVKLRQPRPLRPDERAMLALVLSGSFPDAEALRSQAETATAVGGCDCGCPSIALQVDLRAPVARSMTSRLVPQEGLVRPSGDDEPPGGIILFADDGRLSYLEYVYYTETPPSAWPHPAQVDLSR